MQRQINWGWIVALLLVGGSAISYAIDFHDPGIWEIVKYISSSGVVSGDLDMTNHAIKDGSTLGLNGNAVVGGNVSVGGTLGVTSATTLTGGAVMGADLDMAQYDILDGGTFGFAANAFTCDASANVSVGGTLGVTGATTLTGALYPAGGISSLSNADIVIDANGTGKIDVRKALYVGDSTYSWGSLSGAAGEVGVEGKLEVDGYAYLDGGVIVKGGLYNYAPAFYTGGASVSTSARFEGATAGAQFQLVLNGTLGRQLVLGDYGSASADYDHDTTSYPTMYFQSDTNPDADNRQYSSIYHDGTAAIYGAGTGYHYFPSDVLAANGDIVFTKLPAAGDKFTIDVDQWEFVASGAAANKIVIGATLDATIDAAITRIDLDLAADSASAIAYPAGAASTTIHLEADTAGAAGNAIILTEDVDSGAAFSVTGAGTLTGGRDAITGTPGYVTTGGGYFPGILEIDGTLQADGGIAVGADAGIDSTTDYWLCTAADCASTCQLTIKGGIIVGCP